MSTLLETLTEISELRRSEKRLRDQEELGRLEQKYAPYDALVTKGLGVVNVLMGGKGKVSSLLPVRPAWIWSGGALQEPRKGIDPDSYRREREISVGLIPRSPDGADGANGGIPMALVVIVRDFAAGNDNLFEACTRNGVSEESLDYLLTEAFRASGWCGEKPKEEISGSGIDSI